MVQPPAKKAKVASSTAGRSRRAKAQVKYTYDSEEEEEGDEEAAPGGGGGGKDDDWEGNHSGSDSDFA